MIDDDGLASFEPESDGIDFYEFARGHAGGHRSAIALNPVDGFSEVWVVPAAGSVATGFNGRDAIVMREADFNPERVLLDLELVDVPPGIEAGARIGTATGVLDYAFGNFRIQVTRLGEDRA